MPQLINELEFADLLAPVVAGTSTQVSAALSCNGATNFLFLVAFGALTSTTAPVVSIQGSTDGTNFSDFEGSGCLVADTESNKTVVVECDLPKYTFTHLRVQITRPTANAVIRGVIGCRRLRRHQPVTQGPGIIATSKYVISPPAGTA